MIAAKDFCSLFSKVLKDGWGVAPGFDGQLLTQEMLDSKIEDEAVRKSASKWIGKHVVDGGGLFAHAFRTFGIPDNYADDGTYIQKIFSNYCSVTGKLPKGGLLPGMVLFKKHGDIFNGIGLYVGNSQIIEAKNSKFGIVTTRINSEWTHWGKLKNIEYDEFPTKASLMKQRESKNNVRVLHGSVKVDGIDRVNVRSDKSMDASIIDRLMKGTEGIVIEDCGEFCKIQYLKVGYVKKDFLKEVTSL